MTRHRGSTRDRVFVGLLAAALLVTGRVGAALPADHSAAPVVTQDARSGADANASPRSPLTIAVSADANPDSSGRPSPVVLRIYQLSGDAAFSKTDIFSLLDDDQKALGGELIMRNEYVLAPGETKNLDIALSHEARFVGAMAGFRDARNATWRALVPGPAKGLTVSIERARVRLFPD